MSDNNITAYTINLTSEGATPAEMDALTRQLQQELLNSADVHDATRPTNPAPLETGAKSAVAITVGQVLLEVLPTALPAIIVAIQAWMLRQRDQKIEITIGDKKIAVPRDADPATIQAYVDMLTTEG